MDIEKISKMPRIELVVDLHARWPRSLSIDVESDMKMSLLKDRAMSALGPHVLPEKVRLFLKGGSWLPEDATTVAAAGIVDGSVVEAHRDRGLVVSVTLISGKSMSVDDCNPDTTVAAVADRIADAEGLPRGGFFVYSWSSAVPPVRWERQKTLRDYGAGNDTRHMACRVVRARFVAEEAYAAAISEGRSIEQAAAALLEAHAASEAREAERNARRDAEIAAMKAARAACEAGAAAAGAGEGAGAAPVGGAAGGGAMPAEGAAAAPAACGGAGSSM